MAEIVVISIILLVTLLAVYGHFQSQNLEAARRESERSRLEDATATANEFELAERDDWPTLHRLLSGGGFKFIMMNRDRTALRSVILSSNRNPTIFRERVLEISQILSVELRENERTVLSWNTSSTSSKQSGLTRALIGGAIAGPAGAIVGANTANIKTESSTDGSSTQVFQYADLVIGTREFENPVFEFRFKSRSAAFEWATRIKGSMETASP